MGESKDSGLLRFSSMSGKDARAFRSERKMERSIRRLPTVQRIQRITRNRWKTKLSSGLAALEILQKIQVKSGRSRNKSRTVREIPEDYCRCHARQHQRQRTSSIPRYTDFPGSMTAEAGDVLDTRRTIGCPDL